jgi:hypothetical protein
MVLHDFAAHWHSMIRPRIPANPPVQFACLDFNGIAPVTLSLAQHSEQFIIEIFG